MFPCKYRKGHQECREAQVLQTHTESADKKEESNALNIAIDNMCKKTRNLRRQLRKAIIDHVSDSFLDTTIPLLVLIEAAKNGREKEIKEYAAIFQEHTSRLVESLETYVSPYGGGTSFSIGAIEFRVSSECGTISMECAFRDVFGTMFCVSEEEIQICQRHSTLTSNTFSTKAI
ncbi:hypothetical protein KIL84_003147 [Mauremys mutica]|uniref:Uncharacterized protein n=1 Tax=Mauremys mutica TaxID=74926 RepID=A0A9D3WNZ6_9SAUR|nr:hypothetical protein KIL84_003147 [Mauremys mutica]